MCLGVDHLNFEGGGGRGGGRFEKKKFLHSLLASEKKKFLHKPILSPPPPPKSNGPPLMREGLYRNKVYHLFLLPDTLVGIVTIGREEYMQYWGWQAFRVKLIPSSKCSLLQWFPEVFKGGDEQARELNLLEHWGREW